jgi:NADH-quinone oxidoreductase subunit G
MAVVIVDGHEIQLQDNERLNGIQVAARVGIEIPHYCWHPGLTVVASCRMCLVEVGRRDAQTGKITMQPKLSPACQTPATDGTVFVTNSQKVAEARARVEEGLLIRHPIDCPICDKAGECLLQDYHFRYGQDARRADLKPFTSRRRELGETVTLFVDRCVMCSRCVRFCREIAGTSELLVAHRGAHEEIDVFPGAPLANKLAGNVVDLCPVGALGDRDFLYQQRVWFLQGQAHVCANCSKGCSIRVDQNQDRIYRVKPRTNPHVNRWWICDEGRYGWKHVHDPRRLTKCQRRTGNELQVSESSPLLAELDARLRRSHKLAAVVSPHLTVEEAYLLCRYVRDIDPEAALVLGPVPQVGEDQTYAGQFTIRAEKCPNRRGVEELIAGIAGKLVTWEQFLPRLPDERWDAVWVSGGYLGEWNDTATAEQFASVGTLVVQDLFSSPLLRRADYQLPGAAAYEREGSYVNRADWIQSFSWAIRPPAGVLTEGQVYWRLRKGSGLFPARRVLDEVSHAILYFRAADRPIPELGLDLKVNLLAST